MTRLSRYLAPLENTSSSSSSDDDSDIATAQQAGRTIEAKFDTTSLFAFARAPQAAAIHCVMNVSDGIWAYGVRVLVVLLFPFLATGFVLGTHWKVQSGGVVLGYDPVLIARRADDVLASSSVAGRRCGEGLSGECLETRKVGRGRTVV